MSKIAITFDARDVERKLRELGDQGPKVAARAINRSAASTKTIMVRTIAKNLKVPQDVVRERIGIVDADPMRLRATLTATAKRIPLIDFKAKDSGKRGVRARLPGGSGRYPHAFIRTMRSGHVGVFQRKGRARLPITELHGPSVAKVFENNIQVGIDRAKEQLVKNITSELRFAMAKAK